MNEELLRAMIREAVARRLGQPAEPGAPHYPGVLPVADASHYRYVLPESDGPCIIEPSVQCTHCGYCQSHGH